MLGDVRPNLMPLGLFPDNGALATSPNIIRRKKKGQRGGSNPSTDGCRVTAMTPVLLFSLIVSKLFESRLSIENESRPEISTAAEKVTRHRLFMISKVSSSLVLGCNTKNGIPRLGYVGGGYFSQVIFFVKDNETK